MLRIVQKTMLLQTAKWLLFILTMVEAMDDRSSAKFLLPERSAPFT
tara:strand:- start:1490 stop:1627 length:138 start_codon:yes stop_codon:yes gene_type:complete